jgi:hypothetical protein
VGEIERLSRRESAHQEALMPSAETKAAYSGEFKFADSRRDSDGNGYEFVRTVPWTTVKDIMAAILIKLKESPQSADRRA